MKQTRIAIIGMGLIGGSLAKAFKSHFKEQVWITAVDAEMQVAAKAVSLSMADFGTIDCQQGVKDADVIFICTPVLQIIPIIESVLPFVKPGAIISDTGSTKHEIVQAVEKLLPENIYYVGGHPMAGREKSGLAAAQAELFQGKWYLIIKNNHSIPQAVDTVCSLLQATGSQIYVMDSANHDVCAAVISHVPHIAAAALVNLLDEYSEAGSFLKLAGGGFQDTTRIASSNADMWADICMSNGTAILDSLSHLQHIISETMTAIENKDRKTMHDYFSKAKMRRDTMLERLSDKG